MPNFLKRIMLAVIFSSFCVTAYGVFNAPDVTAPQNNLIQCGDGSWALLCTPGNEPAPTPTVSNVTELQAAVASATSGDSIIIAAGTYDLTNTLVVTADNVTLRGATGDATDVQLVGQGINNASYGNVQHGIWTDSTGLTVRDLTIRDVYAHAIVFNPGAQSPTIRNVRMFDAGEQFIKANPTGWADGVDGGIVENSHFQYTAEKPNHAGNTGYTNGVDVLGGENWIIRGNTFKNFHIDDGADNLWNPAILMWRGAGNTLVENNTFIDVDRAIAFGLEDDANGYSHTGGVIRNNMVTYSANLYSSSRTTNSDASIIVWDSPNTKVQHNTVFTQSNLNHAIEFRFNTTGAVLENNLLDDSVSTRNGGTYTDTNNPSVSLVASLFKYPLKGDLTLATPVTEVARLTDVLTDFNGVSRAATTSVGASQYVVSNSPPGLVDVDVLNYAGAFRLPAQNFGSGSGTNPSVNYTFGAIGHNSTNNSLYVAGHEYGGMVAEFPIPSLVNSTTIGDLNIASSPTQNFTDILGKDTFDLQGGTRSRISGIYENNGRVLVSAYSFYAQSPTNTQFMMLGDSNDLSGGQDSGWLPASNGNGAAAGWISPIPAKWQTALGGTHISGLSNSTRRASTSNLSMGPAAYVINANDDLANYDTRSVIGTVPLIRYTLTNGLVEDDNALYNRDLNNDVWTHASEASYGVIIPGTDTYIVMGMSGGHENGMSYGVPPYGGNQGHYTNEQNDNYPYYWLYDVNDMVSVKEGNMQPHEIKPYKVGKLPLPFQSDIVNGVVGGTFDSTNNILYLSVDKADKLQLSGNSYAPVIVAYNFNVPEPQFNPNEDLTYLGAFRVPDGIIGESQFAYGDSVITYNPDNDSLFMSGIDTQSGIAEISIPTIVNESSNVSALNTGTVLQPFKRLLSTPTNTAGNVMDRIGGMEYLNGQLYVNAYNYYDGGGTMTDTTFVVRDADNLATSQVDGYFQVNGAAYMSGHISKIPTEFQTELGGKYISGQNGIAISTRTSVGPAGYAWDLEDIGPSATGGSIPSTPLLSYPYGTLIADDDGLYNVNLDNDLWTYESRVHYAFIPKGFRTYVHMGRHGGQNSILEYKGTQLDGTVCGGPCVIDQDDVYNFFWLYDLDDLAAVNSGSMTASQPRPVSYEIFNTPFRTLNRHEISGGTYDAANDRLFLTVYGVDGWNPIVLVYQVGTN